MNKEYIYYVDSDENIYREEKGKCEQYVLNNKWIEIPEIKLWGIDSLSEVDFDTAALYMTVKDNQYK